MISNSDRGVSCIRKAQSRERNHARGGEDIARLEGARRRGDIWACCCGTRETEGPVSVGIWDRRSRRKKNRLGMKARKMLERTSAEMRKED